MDEKEWLAFVTVVEEGNITKASTRLFISQPALSYRIKTIEENVGVALLIRSNGGIVLTPEGEVFYAYCVRMLHEMAETKEEMEGMTNEVRGTLTIASSAIFASYELPALLRTYLEKYPKVRIRVKTGLSNQVNKMFNSGECMVAFTRGDHSSMGISTRLYEEPYCLVYHKPVEIRELLQIPLIQYKTDPTVMVIFDEWWNYNFKVMPNVAMALDTMSTCRHFIREGLGWSMLPYLGLAFYKEDNFYIKPITNAEGKTYMRDTSICYSESAGHLSSVKTFLEHVKKHYANLKTPLV